MDTIYLDSTELREPYEPRRCRIVRRLRSEIRDDLALVEVDPPIESYFYDTARDIRYLILASRFEGSWLFPVVSEWPLYVYICLLKEKDKPENDEISSKDFTILDWGEIVNDLEQL